MQRFDRRSLTELAQLSFFGSAGVASFTFVCFRLHTGFAAASLCYLMVILVVSLKGRRAASIAISVAAAGCLDFFFADPKFSFRVDSPLDALALLSFLVTGLVVTHLVTEVRAGTRASQLQHEKLQSLYELSQQLLVLEPGAVSDEEFLKPFLGFFGIRAVCLFDSVNSELYVAGAISEVLEKKTGEAFMRGHDQYDPASSISVRCIRMGSRITGAIGFENLDDPAITAGPLAALATAHLDRAHSFRKASHASAIAHSESYRSAILDALAHEFRTPLSTILAAAGALREAEPLAAHFREMAETVETEAARLSRLSSRLIKTARLEREEVKPWLEVMDVSPVIAETVELCSKQFAQKRISLDNDSESCEITADRELVRLAIGQLLDNACKYSSAESIIKVSVKQRSNFVAVRVISPGASIPVAERTKIFERFYRGIDGQRLASGSGLGLYVARKIAVAHGGSLDLESDQGADSGPVFCMLLPISENHHLEHNNLATAV